MSSLPMANVIGPIPFVDGTCSPVAEVQPAMSPVSATLASKRLTTFMRLCTQASGRELRFLHACYAPLLGICQRILVTSRTSRPYLDVMHSGNLSAANLPHVTDSPAASARTADQGVAPRLRP